MVTLKSVKGQYIVTAAGQRKEFRTIAAALRFVEEYHKTRVSS